MGGSVGFFLYLRLGIAQDIGAKVPSLIFSNQNVDGFNNDDVYRYFQGIIEVDISSRVIN